MNSLHKGVALFAIIASLSVFAGEPTEAPPPSAVDAALVQAINGMMAGVGATTDFVVEQAPEVIQQFLTWKMVSNLLDAIVGAILLGFVLWMFRLVWVATEDSYGKGGDRAFIGILLAIPGLFGFCVMYSSLCEVLKIYIAPKVFLLEYAASLIK